MCLAQGARVAVCGQIAYYSLPPRAEHAPSAGRSPRPRPIGRCRCAARPSAADLKDPLSARAYPATMVALTTSSKIEGFMVPQATTLGGMAGRIVEACEPALPRFAAAAQARAGQLEARLRDDGQVAAVGRAEGGR